MAVSGVACDDATSPLSGAALNCVVAGADPLCGAGAGPPPLPVAAGAALLGVDAAVAGGAVAVDAVGGALPCLAAFFCSFLGRDTCLLIICCVCIVLQLGPVQPLWVVSGRDLQRGGAECM